MAKIIDAEIVSEEKSAPDPSVLEQMAQGFERLGAQLTANRIRAGVEVIEAAKEAKDAVVPAMQKLGNTLEKHGLFQIAERTFGKRSR